MSTPSIIERGRPGQPVEEPPPRAGFLLRSLLRDPTEEATRDRLRRSWGLCSWHARDLLQVEAATRRGRLHGSALLYLDLVERALGALDVQGTFADERAVRRLRATARCPGCELDPDRHASGLAWSGPITAAPGPLAGPRTGVEMEVHRRAFICPRCDPAAAGPHCRIHLPSVEASALSAELRSERAMLGAIARQLIAYVRTFERDHRASDVPEGRAAVLHAVGWCSGWAGPLVALGPRL